MSDETGDKTFLDFFDETVLITTTTPMLAISLAYLHLVAACQSLERAPLACVLMSAPDLGGPWLVNRMPCTLTDLAGGCEPDNEYDSDESWTLRLGTLPLDVANNLPEFDGW